MVAGHQTARDYRPREDNTDRKSSHRNAKRMCCPSVNHDVLLERRRWSFYDFQTCDIFAGNAIWKLSGRAAWIV